MSLFWERFWTIMISGAIGFVIFMAFWLLTVIIQPYVLWIKVT